MEPIGYIIGGFLGGGGFKIIVDWLLERYKNRNKDNFEQLFEDIHEIYSVLNTIKRETFAKRILVFIAQNGGGVPTVDSELASSIKYETYDYPFHTVKDQWQEQRLDENHLMILRRMYIKGSTLVNTRNLPEGDLKDILSTNEVHHSKLFLITGTENKLYYLSLQYNKEYKEEEDHNQRNAIRTSLYKLKEIFTEKGERL